MNHKQLVQRFFFFFGLLFFSVKVSAQIEDTIRISGIPHSLTWLNKPDNFSSTKGAIRIKAGAKTDMFRDPNVTYNTDNAPKLLFNADNNFVLSASIHHSFINKWDGGAFVLYEDSLNWIKFCFEKDYTGAKRVVSVVTKDISDDCNSVAISQNTVFYKMAKADNVITLYYSLDGKKWLLVRHLQFNNRKKIKLVFLRNHPPAKVVKFYFLILNILLHVSVTPIKENNLNQLFFNSFKN